VIVHEVESQEVPEEIELAQTWVINGESAWELEARHAVNQHSTNRFEKIFTGGPYWGPEIAVDVVVSIVGSVGSLNLLQARDQWIHSTL
jgi:hypothetical protein